MSAAPATMDVPVGASEAAHRTGLAADVRTFVADHTAHTTTQVDPDELAALPVDLAEFTGPRASQDAAATAFELQAVTEHGRLPAAR